MRHALLSCLLALGLSTAASCTRAAATIPDVYPFWGQGCPHCERAIEFLQRLEGQDARLRVRYFEVTREAGNAELFRAVAKAFDIPRPGVPLIVIGDRVWVGYSVDEQTGAELRERIAYCSSAACTDSVSVMIPQLVVPLVEARPAFSASADAAAPRAPAEAAEPSEGAAADPAEVTRAPPPAAARHVPEALHLPLIGEIRLRDFSLISLTLLLGALDGFNPCAMWTLVFLIGLLVGMKDGLRMWVLGAAFIAGSAAV